MAAARAIREFRTNLDEITIESGGVKAILPRQMARTAVNQLLAMLNQAPIP